MLSTRLTHTRLRAGLVAGLAALPLVMAGCGGGGSGGDSAVSTASSSAAGGSGAAVLGTPNKATGSPIVIGINNPGKTEQYDQSVENVAARALVKYANEYLGGINGHVIQLKECDTHDTPATEIDCANQAIQAHVSAVIQASADDNTVRTVAGGGIPVFLGAGASSGALTTPGVFTMGNALATYGAPAAYAKEIGAKNTALLVIDVPAASGPVKQAAPALFKNAGSTLRISAVAPGTADMTPQVQAVSSPEPDLYWVLGNPAFCTSAITAAKAVNPDAKIVMLSNCISTDTATIPGGYAGLKTIAAFAFDPTDPDYKLYVEIMNRYGGTIGTQSAFGYIPLLGLIRALNGAKITDTSPAGVLAGIRSAPVEPLPLGKGSTFQCNGKQLTVSKNICSVAGFIADPDAKGNLSNFQVLDDASIYDK
jgi:branched-chain amino acid transport system substrate-binding protein